MEIPDPLAYLIIFLTIISSTIQIINFTNNHWAYVKIVPWKRIANRTLNILRFIGVITGAGALVGIGMLAGSFLIDIGTTFLDRFASSFELFPLTPEIQMIVYGGALIVLVILLGYCLEKIGLGFRALGLYPRM